MITFKKLQLTKEMITQMDICQITIMSNNIIKSAIDLSKQRALDADLKAIAQINFTGNLSGNNNRLMFFISEEAKETLLFQYDIDINDSI